MKFAIAISTYRRGDGSTPQYLTRALESVKNQIHQDYKVFLIGDRYTDHAEFEQLATSIISEDKIYFENRSIAPERDLYPYGTRQLWCSGGVSAYNHAVECALAQGYDYTCHLDHDDFWEADHLARINQVIESVSPPALIYSCSHHINGSVLPADVPLDGKVCEHIPLPKQVVHSSVCINHSLVPLKYRDVYAETGNIVEADIDMWIRTKQFIYHNPGLKSYLIAWPTCHHDIENH